MKMKVLMASGMIFYDIFIYDKANTGISFFFWMIRGKGTPIQCRPPPSDPVISFKND